MNSFMCYFRADICRLGKSYRWLVGIVGVALALVLTLESDLFSGRLLNGNVLSTYLWSSFATESIIAYSFCAFPFAGIYPEEREHHYMRYNVIRGNLKSYVLSKTVIIYLSSLIVMVLGTLLFLFWCRTQVPWMDWMQDDYGIVLTGAYADTLIQGHAILYCGLYAMHMGLIAAAFSNLAALCSVYVSNTVLIYIIPALLLKISAQVNFNGYNVVNLCPTSKICTNDTVNLMLCIGISIGISVISMIGCYFGLKRNV